MMTDFFPHLSSSWQIILGLLPGITVFVFFLFSYLFYRIRFRRGDYPLFAEVERRPASNLLNRHFRTFFIWLIAPVEKALINAQVTPNAITICSVVFALFSGILLAFGQFNIGGWIYILSGTLDVFDGRVARRTGRTSPGGCILDSVSDRYSEFFVFSGLLWFYSSSWVVLLVASALFGSVMVSYVRAKAESLNVRCAVGRFQRAERLVYLGVGLSFSSIVTQIYQPSWAPAQWPAVTVLAFIAVGSIATALYRFISTYRAITSFNFTNPKQNQESRTSSVPTDTKVHRAGMDYQENCIFHGEV